RGDRRLGRRGCCLLLSLATARKERGRGDRNGSHGSGEWRHETRGGNHDELGLCKAGTRGPAGSRAFVNSVAALSYPRRAPHICGQARSPPFPCPGWQAIPALRMALQLCSCSTDPTPISLARPPVPPAPPPPPPPLPPPPPPVPPKARPRPMRIPAPFSTSSSGVALRGGPSMC